MTKEQMQNWLLEFEKDDNPLKFVGTDLTNKDTLGKFIFYSIYLRLKLKYHDDYKQRVNDFIGISDKLDLNIELQENK